MKASSREVSGDVERAGGRSRSATVAPRYLFAQANRTEEGCVADVR